METASLRHTLINSSIARMTCDSIKSDIGRSALRPLVEYPASAGGLQKAACISDSLEQGSAAARTPFIERIERLGDHFVASGLLEVFDGLRRAFAGLPAPKALHGDGFGPDPRCFIPPGSGFLRQSGPVDSPADRPPTAAFYYRPIEGTFGK